MHKSYFKWSNAADWAIYLLALVFVFEFNFLEHFPFGPGCNAPQVGGIELLYDMITDIILVLDVACGLSLDDLCLAQPSQILHTAPLLWNLPHHVCKYSEDHGEAFTSYCHLCFCLRSWLQHTVHKQCEF